MYDELTQQDIDKMKEELDYRITVVRADLHEKIMLAKEFGDLSENAEYHEARRAKGRNESRIEYLQTMIKTAKIITHNQDNSIIGLGNTIDVELDNGKVLTYQIETTVGQDASNGKISKESPFGQAVFGRKVGDRVLVRVNAEFSYYVTIKTIK